MGNNSTSNQSSPVSVVGNHSFIKIIAGKNTSAGLKADGTCWLWGNNASGQLGNGTTTNTSSPIVIARPLYFTQTAGQYQTGSALMSDGTCWCWGYGMDGELGNNDAGAGAAHCKSSPVAVVGNHSFISITGQNVTGMGLKADGTCWTWGYGGNGELGNNTVSGVSSPVSVVGNHSFTMIVGNTGASTAYGLKSNGTAWAWGMGSNGELGNNSLTGVSSPVSVVGNHSFILLMGQNNAGMGLKASGTCWCVLFRAFVLWNDSGDVHQFAVWV